MKTSECLASLAVFRNLYKSKSDVYDVISEFLKEIIIIHSKHSFTLSEITILLNNTFYFSLPDAIVRTSLNRLPFINKESGIYVVNNLASFKSNISIDQTNVVSSNDIIINELYSYIEEKQQRILSEEQRRKVVDSFCSFILDDTNGVEYSEFISAFIVNRKNDSDFTSKLTNIKEGVILYSGIKFNSNINNTGNWNTELTIYIETEILFHFAGYNGDLYSSLFNDFYSFVKEINRKAGRNLVKLRYFSEIKDEIDGFFKSAEKIADGEKVLNPSVTAMASIVDNCKCSADVVLKKVCFFDKLKRSGIIEDMSDDFFSSHNARFNMTSKELLDAANNELGVDDASIYLRFLNYINIRRRNINNVNFENVKFILLSGNSKTIKLSWSERIKEKRDAPLATNLNFLTNKFWFKLNKGFGSTSTLKAFDVVAKAQIVLSSRINESVSIKFEEYKKEYRAGNINEELALGIISSLREDVRKPEDVDEDSAEKIINCINEDNIRQYTDEKSKLKSELQTQKEEYSSFKEQMKLEKLQLENKHAKELILTKIESTKQEINSTKIHLQTKEDSLDREKIKQQKVEKATKIRIKRLKTILGATCALIFLVVCILIYNLGWDKMEPFTYIFSVAFALACYLFPALKYHTTNPLNAAVSLKERFIKEESLKLNYDSVHIGQIISEITTIKEDLRTKKNTLESLEM